MHIFWLRDVKDDAWRGNDHFLHQILIRKIKTHKGNSAGFLRPNLVATSILKAESWPCFISWTRKQKIISPAFAVAL
jgi:hypothetical protein